MAAALSEVTARGVRFRPIADSQRAVWLAVELLLVQLTTVRTLLLCCWTIWGLAGCSAEPLCSFQVLQVARDLQSDRYAATAVRNCGATTDYATVVRVGRASEAEADATEVFVANSDHGAVTSYGRGAIWMDVVWAAPGRLSVRYASKARILRRDSSAKGAVITYKAGDPLSEPDVP